MIVLLDKFVGANDASIGNHTPNTGGPWTVDDGNVALLGNQAVFVDPGVDNVLQIQSPALGNMGIVMAEAEFSFGNLTGATFLMALLSTGNTVVQAVLSSADIQINVINDLGNLTSTFQTFAPGLGNHTMVVRAQRDKWSIRVDNQEATIKTGVGLGIVDTLSILGKADEAAQTRLQKVLVQGQTSL